LYIPTSNQETTAASLSELQTGRKFYIQKCAGCHTLYLPEKYSKAEWHHWIDKMTLKVSMDTLEKEQILKYLAKGK
jgi:cytochrome c5